MTWPTSELAMMELEDLADALQVVPDESVARAVDEPIAIQVEASMLVFK